MLIKRLLLVTILATVSMNCLAISPSQANDWAQSFGVQNNSANRDAFVAFSHCARDEDDTFDNNPRKLLCSSVARAQGTIVGDTTLDGLGQSASFMAAFPVRTDEIAAQYKIVYGANSTTDQVDAAIDRVHRILEEIDAAGAGSSSGMSGGSSTDMGLGAGAGAGSGAGMGPDLGAMAPLMGYFSEMGISDPADALAAVNDDSRNASLFPMYNKEIKSLFNTLTNPLATAEDRAEAERQLNLINVRWYKILRDLEQEDRTGVKSAALQAYIHPADNPSDDGSGVFEYGRSFKTMDFEKFKNHFGI